MKTPGGGLIRIAGRRQVLEDAEHDGADKRQRQIRGNNAQSGGERHGKAPWFTSLPAVTRKLINRSARKKSGLLPLRADAPPQGRRQRG
jgi:hypothetical protein